MNDADYHNLLEIAQRRALTAEDQTRLEAYFADQPDRRAAWQEEWALNQLLGQMSPAPISSNFTAQVLGAIEREQRKGSRRARRRWLGWLFAVRPARQTAMALVVVGLGCLTYFQYQSLSRASLARNVAEFSDVATLPSVEALRDFEAINRLSQMPPVDEELWAALK